MSMPHAPEPPLHVLSLDPALGRKIIEPALNREQPAVVYPGGVSSIRSFVGD